jgi:hypothetical protein
MEQMKAYLRDFSIQFTTRTITSALAVILLISAISLGAAFDDVSVFSGERGVSASSNPSGSVLTGTVESPNGTAVEDATVAVVGNSSLTAQVDSGSYRVTGVPPGEHEILVSSSKHGTTSESVVIEESDIEATETITFDSGGGSGSTSSDDSTQATEQQASDESGSDPVLIGTVENSDDDGIEDATVTVDGADLSTETDADGNYRLEEMPTREVDIMVTHPEYEQSTLTIDVDEDDSPETLYPTLDPDPNTQATLIGTVENQNGDGVSNAAIELSPTDSEAVLSSDTDIDGQYRIEDVPSGDIDISVAHEDYRSTSRTLDIDPAETATSYFTIESKPPAAWETTIASANGTPIYRNTRNVSTPRAPPETQSVRLWSPVSTDRVTGSGEAHGVTNLSLPGNRLPTNVTLTIGGGAGTTGRNLSRSVDRDATNTSIPLRVGGDLPTDVALEIEPATNTSATNTTGRINRTTSPRRLALAGDDLPDQLAVDLRGVETLTPHNYSAAGDTTYNISYAGNLPAIGNTTIQLRLKPLGEQYQESEGKD